MDPESIIQFFSLFYCFGSTLYELLITGLMDPVYQSDAYEALPEVVVNKGKGAFISGEQREQAKFCGEQIQYSATGNIRKQIFDLGEKGNKPI